ncbi:hypothetical protein HZS_2420 [Henneguya salminicola]|nr:hypothetical protein HZS_2420 [Henneguya salminicola]
MIFSFKKQPIIEITKIKPLILPAHFLFLAASNERREFLKLKYIERVFINNHLNTFEANIMIRQKIKDGDDVYLFKCILQNANVQLNDNHGDTLLHYAVRNKNLNAFTILYLWGSNLYAKNLNFESCIDVAKYFMSLKFKEIPTIFNV